MAKEKELKDDEAPNEVKSKKTASKKKTVRKKVVRKKKIAKKKVAKEKASSLAEEELEAIKNDSLDNNDELSVAPEPEPEPGPPPPEEIDLAEFQNRSMVELYELGSSLGLRVGGMRSKHDIVFEILCHWGKRGTKIRSHGFLETAKDGYGFLRVPSFSFAKHADDIYIGSNFIKQYDLRIGNLVTVIARAPKDRERFLSTNEVIEIEGIPAEDWESPPVFENLTAISPRERIILEPSDGLSVSPRVVDLIAPLGKGQRGVIVAPPRGGKTILLKQIAKSIVDNHKEVELLILLLDERPEEVTDFEESVPGAQVYSSTFDESPDRHVSVAELVAERAKRVTEMGKDAVILMDSLTRLARGYNGLISTGGRGRGRRGNQGQSKGRTGSGGLDTRALPKARKIFSIARNAEEGGSLTMLATALIDTGSRADEIIFEEFKGSGNMEIQLDRELLERRIYPAINIPKSGTRKDELLYHPDEFKRIGMLRRQLAQRPGGEAMEVLIDHIQNSASNAELLLTGLR
jgi:transcription termination factor Rho